MRKADDIKLFLSIYKYEEQKMMVII